MFLKFFLCAFISLSVTNIIRSVLLYTGDHWNLVQPDILPLGRYPVAVIADVKDKLWCSSGSQIYVVSKKGDRIQVSVDIVF